MPTTSLIKSLLDLATAVQVRTRGGWPVFDLPPTEFPPECSPQDPGLEALLKDYDGRYLGTTSPRIMVCAEPFPEGESLDYLKKWLGAIQVDLERDCFLLSGPRAASQLGDLEAILNHLSPRCLLVLGSTAGSVIVGSQVHIEALRDQTREFRGRPMVITYHPSIVLQNLDLKRSVWKDLQRVQGLLQYGRS